MRLQHPTRARRQARPAAKKRKRTSAPLSLAFSSLALLILAFVSLPAAQRSTAQILKRIAAVADPLDNPFLSHQRAEIYRAQLKAEDDPVEKLIIRVNLAVELLHSAQTENAIKEMLAVQAEARALNAPRDAPVMKSLRKLLALAYLRLGEQENCVLSHSADSCLMPIRGRGVHARQEGSREAARRYRELLKEEPKNLGYRWLLNLAHMTLGEYPDNVPRQWRIPPEVFESDYPLPRFSDIAPQLGLDVDGLAGGSVTEDFDGDGYLDLVVSSWMLGDPLRYFHNNADGTFSEWTVRAGLEGVTGGLNLTHADYNNDGAADILVLRGGWLGFMKPGLGNQPNTLLRNLGDGTFIDATDESGTLDFHPSQTAAWADFNLDGALDLFVGNESFGEDRHPCQLYRNNGDGTFTDVAREAGVDHVGLVKGAAWGDYDNDGRPDLYLSRFGQSNILFHNEGPHDGIWKFADRTRKAGVAEPQLSFPAWFWDYDNDGWEDLLAVSFSSYSGDTLDTIVADYLGRGNAETSRLYRNNRDGTFRDVTKKARLDAVLMAMGANYGDLDNDGFLDCYIGTGQPQMATLVPNRMFRNAAGRFFQDVTTAGGFGHLQKGHGISFADLDNDGDLDVHAVLGGAFSGDTYRNALFLNPGTAGKNHWLGLELRGSTSNRMGQGARIKVVVETPEGERAIYRTVTSGGSFGSSSLRVHIGLGNARKIQSITIQWPVAGSPEQKFASVPMDQVVRIYQDLDTSEPVQLKTLALTGSRDAPKIVHDHPGDRR